jgi:CspA family cold shock protein
MAKGTVKWFNSDKGFGFIIPDDGGKDIFLHHSELRKTGLREIDEGAKVEYDTKNERGRVVSSNIKVL